MEKLFLILFLLNILPVILLYSKISLFQLILVNMLRLLVRVVVVNLQSCKFFYVSMMIILERSQLMEKIFVNMISLHLDKILVLSSRILFFLTITSKKIFNTILKNQLWMIFVQLLNKQMLLTLLKAMKSNLNMTQIIRKSFQSVQVLKEELV